MRLFYGGNIITMTGKEADCVLTDGGIIKAVGRFGEIREHYGDKAELTDLKSNLLLPGYIDAHSHIAEFAKSLESVNLSAADSIGELLSLLEKKAAEGADFISSFGYDDNILKEHRHPTRQELDSVSASVPIIATHSSGHMGVLNSAALEMFSIDENTPEPEGGKIGKTNGRLNGYLEEAAFSAVTSSLKTGNLTASLEKAQEIYLKNGITTAQEGFLKPDTYKALTDFAAEGRLKLDVVGYADNKNKDFTDTIEFSKEYKNRFRVGGIKLFLDGSPQGKTAWMSVPYKGSGGMCGYPIYTNERLTSELRSASEKGLQVIAHANGDMACRQFADCAERAGGLVRPVAIHCQFADRGALEKMAKLGMTASFFISHIFHFADIHLKNIDRSAVLAMSPAKTALELGTNYTFHQDTPVLAPDMAELVRCAEERKSKSGEIIGKDQCLTRAQALAGITKNAAYQYLEEKSKGTIEEGKRADLVVADAKTLKPLMTIKDGITVSCEDS